MTIYGLAVFSLVYALAVASPGPGVAAVVARSLVRGTRGVPAFIAGFVIGDLVWFTVAVTGLAALAQTAGAVFAAIKYAGAAYLLYLAWRMWTTRAIGPSEGDDQPVEALSQRPSRLFAGSLALTLGTYVLAAARARRMLQNPRAVQIVNRTGASVMAGAAIAVARS